LIWTEEVKGPGKNPSSAGYVKGNVICDEKKGAAAVGGFIMG